MNRFLPWVLVALVSSGCSMFGGLFGDEDNALPPEPLVDLDDPPRVRERWSTDTGSGTEEQRIRLVAGLSGDRVFVANRDGNVAAYSTEKGKRVWKTDTDAVISAGPGISDDLILLGTSDAEVLALEKETGVERWRVRVSSEVLAPPEAGSGVVAVHTVDGRLAGLNLDTGGNLWIFDQRTPVLTLRGTGAPVISGDRVISGFASGKLAALRIDNGATLWETRITFPGGRSELERIVDLDADPVLLDGIIFSAAFQSKVTAVDEDTGVILWEREMSSFAGMDVDYSRVYVTDADSRVWALDQGNGGALWKQEALLRRALTAPVVHGEFVVVGDYQGYLHWLSRDDGRLVARHRVDSDGISSKPVVVDDILYVLGDGGELAAIELPGEAEKR